MKTVLITGITRGLGLAIARQLVGSGEYLVIGTGRKLSDELRDLMATEDYEERLVFRPFDVSRLDAIHEFVVEVTREYGPLYGLVNNAAIGHDGVLATMHEKDIAELLTVNLHAPILFSKYASRSMLTQLQGRIIQISSIIADTGFKGLAVYGATKAGLIGLTKSLARELGRGGITVNAVLPGYMETAMTSTLQGDKLASIKRRSPSGRLASVEDVAATVEFLLGPAADSITGTTFTVDAGSTA